MKNAADFRLNPGKECIVFTGPPTALSGNVVVENLTRANIRIGDLPVVYKKGFSGRVSGAETIPLHAELLAGERREKRVRVALDETTPPGEYDAEVAIGGEARKVKFVVQPHIHAEIHPSQVSLVSDGRGSRHLAEILFMNRGNVPLPVPEGELGQELSSNAVCACLAQALLQSQDKGAAAALEAFTAELRGRLDAAVRISCEEAGRIVGPGETIPLRLVFSVPQGAAAKKQCEGDFKIYNQKCSWRMVEAKGTKPALRKEDKEA